MKFYDVMYLTLNGTISLLKLIEDPREEIMQERLQHRKFYMLGYGG